LIEIIFAYGTYAYMVPFLFVGYTHGGHDFLY